MYLQIDVVFHESHSRVSRPAFLVVITHNVLIVRIGMFCEISLYQVTRLLGRKPANRQWKSELDIGYCDTEIAHNFKVLAFA